MQYSRSWFALASVFSIAVQPAFALESFKLGTVKFDPALEVGIGFVDNVQQAFGSKTSSAGLPVDRSGQRWEGYIKPSMAFEIPTSEAGTFYGKASVVSAMTRGDSDGLGYTRGDPTDTDWDDGYVGWKSGDTLSWLGTDGFSLSVGRQPFMIGSGFLIGEGHIDQGHESNYWLAPRKAFDWTALAQLNVGQFHADVFQLKTRQDIDVVDYTDNVTVNGFNTEWRSPAIGTYGATMFWTRDNTNPTRDGMQVKDVRASLSPLANLPGLTTAGEYVWQENNRQDRSGNAWFMEATYTFKEVPWQPVLTYRYSKFSEKYDSLLYGYSGDYGYWFQGEIVGESMLFNMNERVNMLKLNAYPTAEVRLGAVAYQFSYDKAPDGVSSRDFAKEFDLYLDWMPDTHWTVGTVFGVAKADDGGKQAFGNDRTSYLFEGYATYKF